MNCPECEREVYGGSCRCGWRAPLVENNAEPKSKNLCKTPSCANPWSINGYCRECYADSSSREVPATDEVARDSIARIRSMLGRVQKATTPPYDKNRRLA